ncbi:MAG: hypothetical protein ACJA0Y_002403, partial [Maricaulis maris]
MNHPPHDFFTRTPHTLPLFRLESDMAVISKLNTLVDLAREKSSDRRRTLLREVTDLFFEETPERDSAVSGRFDDVLSALAEQTAVDAREELSQRFSGTPLAPRGLVLKLAQDAIEVAGPMLSQSSVLSEDDLLSIAEKSGQDHLKAMSKRDAVSERLSDTIVRRGDDETVATLISNDGAQLSRETYETVSERAENSEVLQGPLVKRKDTPNDILADMMLTVRNHLRDHIMERFDSVDPAIIDQAMAVSKARLAARLQQDKAVEEAQKFVRSMAMRKKLDGALLARLLREGDSVKCHVVFAEMTGVDYIAAKRALEQDSIDPLALICKSAGFDKALFVTLAVLRHKNSDDAFRDARELGQLYDKVTADDAAR